MPTMAQRRPDRCRNSCIASRHPYRWTKAIANGEELLKTRQLSPLQREVIKTELSHYRKVLRKPPATLD